MGRKKNNWAAVNEFTKLSTGGNNIIPERLDHGSQGRKRTVQIVARGGNSFWNPNVALCHSIRDQLLKNGMSSPVRFPQERIGEVCNLKDPQAQIRSIAAILAKKYQGTSQFLRNIYNAAIHRELTNKECAAVMRAFHALGVKDGESGPEQNQVAGSGGGSPREMGPRNSLHGNDELCPDHSNGEPASEDPGGLVESETEDDLCLSSETE